jgi:NADH:ubiquinone oxidoreductase subunit K
MTAEAFVFWVFAIVTVSSAAVVVLSRQLIYSAFALLFTFFGVAGLYVLLGADFLAAVQLLVYVGGILVLLLFGVMLTHKVHDLDLRGDDPARPRGHRGGGALRHPRLDRGADAVGAAPPARPDHGGDRAALPRPVPAALRGRLRPPPGRPRRRRHDRGAGGTHDRPQHYLVVSAALFSLGVLGLLTRRNAVHVLMSIELILNSANVNLVAFSRFSAGNLGGQVFGVFVIVVAAAEVAVGLAIVLTLYRLRRTPNLDDADILKG